MTTAEAVVYCLVWGLLAFALGVGGWLCFRRSRAGGFLLLTAVLVLWPWFDWGSEALRRHFTSQALQGTRPWLFPFSLMAPHGGAGMTPGESLTKLSLGKELLFVGLVALAVCLIARRLGRADAGPRR